MFSFFPVLLQDHVNFIIGRQSFNLGNLADAQVALQSLLLYESRQPPSQQASHLREFLAVFKVNINSTKLLLQETFIFLTIGKVRINRYCFPRVFSYIFNLLGNYFCTYFHGKLYLKHLF